MKLHHTARTLAAVRFRRWRRHWHTNWTMLDTAAISVLLLLGKQLFVV